MSFGFLALNDSNDVLISSDAKKLALFAKEDFPDVCSRLRQTTTVGMRRWIYSFSNVSVTPVPFFSAPTTDFYAISRVENKGSNNWDIEVIRSGTSTSTPEVYLFADPRAGSSTEAYGMVVYMDDGTAAFDSRLKPLAVTGGSVITHPSNPRTSFSSTGLDQGTVPQTQGLFLRQQSLTTIPYGKPTSQTYFFFL